MIRRGAVAFGLYALTSLIAAGPPPSPSALLGFGNDPESFVWFLRWWPWALLRGHDPFVSHLVYAPAGYSMAWATSVPTASVLALPITLLDGPVAAFNALTLLAHPLAATTAFMLAYELTGGMAASLASGFMFGFSGYENGQILGHLNLDLVFLLPLLVILCIRRARRLLGRTPFVALTALVLAAQFGLSSEVFATTVLSGCLLLLLGLMLSSDRQCALRLTAETVLATGAAILLVSPMLASMARHADDMPEFINRPSDYSNDLLNLVVPTRAEAWHGIVTERIARHFTGNGEEQDLYVGLPLVAIFCRFAVRARGWCLAVAVAAGLLTVASLGPMLQVAGHVMPIPLPWVFVAHLPLLRGALPCRLGLEVGLAAGTGAAFWIAERANPPRIAAALLACACLLPGRTRESWSRVDVPALFLPGCTARLIAGNALLLPFTSADTMLWQAVSGMAFSQAGGVLSFIPLAFQREPAALSLVQNRAGPAFTSELADFVRRHDVHQVVEGPGTGASISAALASSGWPQRTACGVKIVEIGLAR